MPVSLAVGDISSFRKYVKYIGRAYQKRSVAMIQLCRLFLEISPGKPDQMDALKSLLETVEDALKAAVDAGKERSDAADTAFATAEEELDWYAGWQHPEQQTVLDDVQNIIEDAAQKDSQIMKIHKRLSTRLGLNKTDSSSLVKVHFQILHAPTDRREAPVVTCELGPDVKISELLWTFSRLPEDQRISLKQNPHFYFSRDLSDQASAYDDQFKLEPLKDLKPEKNSVVMVLLDRAGQIFVDYQKFSKTYGNIWRPHSTIILKDLQGTLEAANRISPSISGEVCIWQRGGGRPGEDLSEWTKVLNKALDLPDVDWLIRSETSPDEAFDIEVTGGWERCSPATTPGSGLRVQDHSTPSTPLQEGIHTPLEQVPSPTSESSSIPLVGFSSQESSYPIADTPPSDVTVNIPSEESQYIVEECPSPDEDKDVLTLKDSSPLESAIPQVEVAVHPPVHSSNISHELIPPPPESELAFAGAASSPEKIVSTAVASVSSPYEAFHTQTQHGCFSSKPLTTPIGGAEVPCSSLMLTPLKNTMPDDVHLQTEVDCSPMQPTRVPRKPSVVGGGELAPTSSASTPINTPGPEHTPPEAEVVHAPVRLERLPPERLTQRLGYNVYPTSISPTHVGITPSNGAFVQTGTAYLSSVPLEQPKPAAPPTSNHTTVTSDTSSKTESTKRIESVGSLAQFILHPGNKATHAHGPPTPSVAATLSERAHSRVEVVGHLEIKRPPAPSREPTLSIVKMPEPIGRTPLPYISPTPSEHARPKIGAASTTNQNVYVSPKSRIPSTATDNVPSSRVTPSGGRIKVEARPPLIRPAPVRPDPRTTFVGKQSALLNSMPVSDIELPSRSRIKSHPKKMTTPISQRQSAALSTQMNVKLGPTVQSSGLPSALPVVRSASSLVPSHKDVTIFHTSLAESSNLGMNPVPRGGYQCYARGLAAPPSAQDSISQSCRSTVVPGQMPPHLTALSSDKYAYAQRPVEKSVPSSARNRSNSASIGRQDSTAGTLSHSSQTRSSSLAVIMEGQGAAKSHSLARSATPPRAITTAVKGEKVDATIASTPPNSTHVSSIFNIKPSAMQPRKAMVVPEQVTSHPAVRSSNQPVIGLQSVPSPAISSRNISYPITMARPDKTSEILSYNSRTDIPGVAAIATATDTRGDLKGHTIGSRMPSTLPVGGAVTSASSVWNSTTRTPSRIKTKDLIRRHKQQNTADTRPPSIAQSLSKSPTSGLSHSAPLAGKPDNNRIDSGIELWDYDPHGVMHNRRRGQDASSNGHGSPRDTGPSSPLPNNSPVVSSNVSSKDSTGPLLSTKKSRASILGSPSPIVGRTHSSRSNRRMSTPPPPESVKASLPSIAGSSTSNLSSTPPGRREPFINRKPQPASQSTSQGGVLTQSGFSTPPRSSTPSSMSHSASITTSTHATMFTPATSFTIPSRAPSPAIDVTHRSWFRRNVLDPVKSKLGYGS